jgi:hypothetical protein
LLEARVVDALDIFCRREVFLSDRSSGLRAAREIGKVRRGSFVLCTM